jgi:hypothetical protein
MTEYSNEIQEDQRQLAEASVLMCFLLSTFAFLLSPSAVRSIGMVRRPDLWIILPIDLRMLDPLVGMSMP